MIICGDVMHCSGGLMGICYLSRLFQHQSDIYSLEVCYIVHWTHMSWFVVFTGCSSFIFVCYIVHWTHIPRCRFVLFTGCSSLILKNTFSIMVLLRIIERKTEISHAKNPWNVATPTQMLYPGVGLIQCTNWPNTLLLRTGCQESLVFMTCHRICY